METYIGGKGKDTPLVETGIGEKGKGLLLVETCYAHPVIAALGTIYITHVICI